MEILFGIIAVIIVVFILIGLGGHLSCGRNSGQDNSLDD